jgi:hypothetical protein
MQKPLEKKIQFLEKKIHFNPKKIQLDFLSLQ